MGYDNFSSEHLLKRLGKNSRRGRARLAFLFNILGLPLLIIVFILCFQKISSLSVYH